MATVTTLRAMAAAETADPARDLRSLRLIGVHVGQELNQFSGGVAGTSGD
jgi:hypothetical protein